MITPETSKTYIVKHSSGLIRARFIGDRELFNRNRKRYVFLNENTGREITLKSRVKILRPTGNVAVYHVGLIENRGNGIAVFQYRANKDTLSPALIEYLGSREASREEVEYRVKESQYSILKALQNKYPRQGFTSVAVDFEE